jgi:hypothetical protein
MATLCLVVLGLSCAAGAWALDVSRFEPEPISPEATRQLQGELIQQLAEGTSLFSMRQQGMLTFTTPITAEDGFGDGPWDAAETPPTEFGHRPTLQGNGTLLRVNGLDAQSCNECHTIVDNSDEPPTLGIGGVGGMVQNAIILPSMIDVGDSFDDRVTWIPGHDPDLAMVADGVADFNGRFANPPFLFGGGGVEMLGKEMTADLQDLLDQAQAASAGTIVSLDTHGVNFGYLISEGGGDVDLSNVEGVGPEHIDSVPPEEALVVRPFGRKGENFSMRDFDRGAMQFHFGIQPVEVVGAGVDEDGDGHTDEITVLEMTNLHVFDVTNPPPFVAHLGSTGYAGFQTFQSVGCANCHRPVLKTNERRLPLAFPEDATDPSANVYMTINLRHVGFDKVPGEKGVFVPLFSDLKRHNMGPRLAETFELGEIANEEFITARLWGIADTAPYLHDGRATSLYDAIEFHGGEAQSARDAFLALSSTDQQKLLYFLSKLKAPIDPNVELIP